jgi:hypothetical protein
MLKDRKAQIELVKSYRKPTDAEMQEMLDHLLDEDDADQPGTVARRRCILRTNRKQNGDLARSEQ